MRLFGIALALLVCSGCTHTVYVFRDPPEIPELESDVKDPCVPLPPVPDRTKASLGVADANAAYAYAFCKDKHKSAVAAYYVVKQAREDYLTKKKQEEQTKKK